MNSERYQEDSLHPGGSDEIDILDVLNRIWAGKFLIIGIAVVSAVLTLLLLNFSTSYYSVSATIDVVTEDQLRPIAPSYLKISDSQTYSTDEKKKAVEYQISYPDIKKIYDRVLLQVDSISVMKAFWEKKTGVSIDLRPEAPETEDVLAFKLFYKGFSLEPANPKALDVMARRVSLEYPGAEQGVSLLSEYLDFLNEYVLFNYLHNLKLAYRANLNALEINYQALNKIEQRRLNDRIIILQENLKLAESLGIKETPFKELENIQLRVLDGKDYLLGTKPLSQQIEILTARQGKSLAPFSLELRNLEIWRDQMSSDAERLSELSNIRLFSIVNSPEASLGPVKPNKVLIFLAVIFTSIVVGILIVLIRPAMLARRIAE